MELNALLNMDEKNDCTEKGEKQMGKNDDLEKEDLADWNNLWDDEKQTAVEKDNVVQKDIIVVDVIHCDEHQYFKFDNIEPEEIKDQLRHTDRPMVDLTGEVLTLPEFAQLEQSSKVSLSLTVNMDERTVTVYETNNISEDLRTDDNTSIETLPMDEFLNGKHMPEKERSSVLERLHQNQKQLKNVNPSGQELIHRKHETVK